MRIAKSGVLGALGAVVGRYANRFASVDLFTVRQTFGGRDRAQAVHVPDDAVFDRIYGAGGGK
jgi:ABC-type sulfate transport system substrate-binding protein